MFRTLCLSSLVLALAACGTTQTPVLDAKPAKDILDQSFLQLREGAGTVYVVRDTGVVGSSCIHRVIVDGKPVADLWKSEMVRLVLTPGEHLLTVQNRCLGAPTGDSSIEVVSSPARDKLYRTSVQSTGNIAILPTNFQ